MTSDTRDIHIHLTAHPGTTVHVTVAGDSVEVAGDGARPRGSTAATIGFPDAAMAAAIERLEASGTSLNVREAIEGLLARGYALRIPETNVPGKRPENYLRIMDPGYSAHGVGYLTPSTFSFSRMSDRDVLIGLPGATPVTNAVNFSHAESAELGLHAAQILMETAENSGSSSPSSATITARPTAVQPGFTHCQRCGYPFGGLIQQEVCNVKQACDRRLREPGYRVPKGRTQDLAIRDATISQHPELGPR